jgi:hypothetical protein
LREGAQSIASSRRLSVVVGSIEASRSIGPCLDALRESCAGIDSELLIVSAGTDTVVEQVVGNIPCATLVTMAAGTLTPRLWSEGITLSSGEIVALLTAHCVVSRGWAAALVSAIDEGASAAGGPLRLAEDASTLDAAIFFLRYSAFIERARNTANDEIAGDNSAYRRQNIPAASWSRESGFWETEVNRAIAREGSRIAWREDAVVEFSRSFGFSSICRHRFAHARRFGASRVADRGESRLRIGASAPLVPWVLAARIWRRVNHVERYRSRFLAALPIILALAASWAAGEAVGAMEGAVANRR